MSNNKYIIDKDSLTGIADAVRDKLGNGEAITDEDAGYYPQGAIVGKFSTPSHTATGAETWTTCSISSQNYSLYFDKPFYQISVTGTFVVGTTFKLHANYDTKDCAGGYHTYIWTWTSPQTSLTLLSQSYGSATIYSTTNGYSSELTIVFKDQDGNVLIPKTSSIQYVSGSTTNFLLGQVYLPVPFSIDDIQDKITNYLGKKSGLIYRYHINPQKNESGTAFAGSPLSEMNVLDYGVTSVSQIKFMLIYGQSSSGSFTWYPSNSTYTMIINGKLFSVSNSGSVYWPDHTSDSLNSAYSLQLCPSKLSNWPLGIMRGNPSRYSGDTSLQSPRIVFMVLDLEA